MKADVGLNYNTKSKGLSQILYLIIAASVLMMVAMVITFTATDIIGGAGGQATDNTCNEALTGKCNSLPGSGDYVSVPDTCVREGQFIGAAGSNTVYNSPNPGGSPTTCTTPPPSIGGSSSSSCGGQVYVQCPVV